MPREKIIALNPVDDPILSRNFDEIYSRLSDFQDIILETPSAANVEFNVSHDLNRPISHVILLRSDKAGSVYFSEFDNPDRNRRDFVVLKASDASMKVKIRLE